MGAIEASKNNAAIQARKSSSWFRVCCVGKPHVQYEDSRGLGKPGEIDGGSKMIFVRTTDSTGSSSAGTPECSSNNSPGSIHQAPSPRTGSSSSSSIDGWYDCEEEWGASQQAFHDGEEESEQQGSTLQEAYYDRADSQQQLDDACYDGLPAELATILQKYQQGAHVGCKPAVALVQYMERSNTSLEQLTELLAPLIAAEAGEGAAQELPAPTPHMSPLERTQSLRSAALAHTSSQQGVVGSSSSQQQQQQQLGASSSCRPRVSRLLGNVVLARQTLAGMSRLDGFKQVAWGPLALWYMHDTVNHCQVIRAKTVLDEPVVNAVCLAREVDLVTSWNPAIAQMAELGAYSPAELLVYMLLWVPWPLPSPEVINYCVGLDLLDTQEECVLLATKGTTEDQLAGVAVPQHARAQRLTMDAGGFKFVPLPPAPDRPGIPRMEATVLISIDARQWTVPDSLISFVLKVFAPLVYKSVLKVLHRMFHTAAGPSSQAGNAARTSTHDVVCGGSALMERIGARPEYAAIATHTQQYLAAKAATPAAVIGQSSSL